MTKTIREKIKTLVYEFDNPYEPEHSTNKADQILSLVKKEMLKRLPKKCIHTAACAYSTTMNGSPCTCGAATIDLSKLKAIIKAL